MKNKLYLSLATLFVLNATASDIGVIEVESSTIDEKFANKMTEISSTSTLLGKEVEDFHAENLIDVLNTIPGVTARKNEGDSNKIHIRGIATEVYMGEKPGVAIVIDGVPVQERAGSVNIDSDNIESIKVLKGGASYLYGNDALAGAIIITTKRPKNKNEGFATIEQGRYGYAKYIASYNVGTDNFAANIQASNKKSDGYWDNSDYSTKSINGKLQYYIDDSSDITLGVDKTIRYENDTGSLTHTTFDRGMGEYTNNIETNPKSFGEVGYATNYDIDLTKLFLTYSKDFENDSNLMTQIYQYEDNTANNSAPFDSNGNGMRDEHKNNSYANTTQRGVKSEYRMKGELLAGMLGLDIARNKEDQNSKYRVNFRDTRPPFALHPIGETVSDTKSLENINAIYGEIKYKINKALVTTLNARHDQINYDFTNNMTSTSWQKTFNQDSYRAGASYNLKDKQVIYTSISTGFRVPTLAQMYAGDMATSTYNGTFSNNPNIQVETTINYELGFRHQIGLLSYDIAIFQIDRNNVIGRSSGNYASTSGVDVNYDNMGDVQSRGLELSLNSDKSKQLSFVLNYTYLNSKYTRYDEFNRILTNQITGRDYVEGAYNLDGNRVPRTPNHTLYLEGNYRVIPSLLLMLDTTYKSSQYADDMNEVKVDAYTVVNLRANYQTKISQYDLEFFTRVDNVLNEQYFMMPRLSSDRNGDGLYDFRDMGLTLNPGRTLLAGLSAKF